MTACSRGSCRRAASRWSPLAGSGAASDGGGIGSGGRRGATAATGRRWSVWKPRGVRRRCNVGQGRRRAPDKKSKHFYTGKKKLDIFLIKLWIKMGKIHNNGKLVKSLCNSWNRSFLLFRILRKTAFNMLIIVQRLWRNILLPKLLHFQIFHRTNLQDCSQNFLYEC